MRIIPQIIFVIASMLFITNDALAQDMASDLVEDKSELKQGENIDEKIRKNFFLRAEVSKNECFVGEPLMAVFKAYSRLDANSQVLKRPSLGGFSVIEMVDAYNNQPVIESLNGVNYYVHLIRKVQLFPLQPGTFTIEPAEVESIIHLKRAPETRSLKNLRDIFKRDVDDSELERQIIFQTPVLDIHVKALPDKNLPDDYTGAVGDFLVQLQMPDTAAISREPVNIKLIVSGQGNFPLVTEPHIAWPLSAEISGPVVTEQVNKYAYPLSGMKSYQFTIEHRDTGSFKIPPVKFSFFDPISKTYKIAQSNEITYTVSASSGKINAANEELIFRSKKETPIHYYYFAAIVLAIISIIIYFMLKPQKDH